MNKRKGKESSHQNCSGKFRRHTHTPEVVENNKTSQGTSHIVITSSNNNTRRQDVFLFFDVVVIKSVGWHVNEFVGNFLVNHQFFAWFCEFLQFFDTYILRWYRYINFNTIKCFVILSTCNKSCILSTNILPFL